MFEEGEGEVTCATILSNIHNTVQFLFPVMTPYFVVFRFQILLALPPWGSALQLQYEEVIRI